MPVCIAGMHRSGTSMVARLLADCGLDLGPQSALLPPREHNPAGHWEHASFVRVNDKLIKARGGWWYCPPLASDELVDQELFDEAQHLAGSLCSEFRGHEQ